MTFTEAQIERAAIVIYMMHNSRSERDWRAIDQTTRNYYKYLAKQAFDAAMEAERGVSTLEIAKIKSALPLYDERAIFEIIQQYHAVRKQLRHRDMGPEIGQ